jgi:hypothetical protein
VAKSRINIKLNISKFTGKLLREVERRMARVATALEAYVKSSMTVSNMKGKNPSKPGNVPNVGLGTLRNNITNLVIVEGKDVVAKYGVAKGPASDYALRLEKGFTGRDKRGRIYDQAARPFLKPALWKNKRLILQILKRG